MGARRARRERAAPGDGLGALSPGGLAVEGGRVSVWTGAGPGAWSIERIEWSTNWPLLGGVAADFDGDGVEDVLSATPEPLLAVLAGQGDGALACAEALALFDVTAPELIATGDLDGGGDLEIAAGGLNTPEVSILRRP